MKSNLRAILVAVIALALCLTALMPAALAGPSQSIKASITIHGQIKLRGGSIPAVYDRFYLRLTPADSGCPMPPGYEGKPYDVEAAGYARTVPVDFPALNFTELGVYHYTISQIPKKVNPRLAYDTLVYDLTISVFNGEKGIEVAVAMRRPGGETKFDEAVFVNTYDKKDGKITPTGVSENWPWLAGGSLSLAAAAGFVFRSLRKKKDGAQ